MQCKNCRFENMPGIEACGRCNSSLRLATATLEVQPPRATPWEKRARRWVPFRSYFRARDAVRTSAAEISHTAHERLAVSLPSFGVLWRMLVPGLAQLYRGQRVRGYFCLALYVPLLLVNLVIWGTVWGSIFVGLLISVHVSAALDVLWQDNTVPPRPAADTPARIVASLLVALILVLLVYAPAGWLLNRIANPLYMNYAAAPFAPGDVLLVNYWATPKIGQVVLHNNPRVPNRVAAPTLMHTTYVFQGPYIDRIVAGPGDKVQVKSGQVHVNGEKSAWQPLNPARLPQELTITVPDGEYLILPTATPNVEAIGTLAWKSMCLVPEGGILGRVYLRNQPLRRFWLIR